MPDQERRKDRHQLEKDRFEQIRRELISRARRPRSRNRDRPNKWHPTEVINPVFSDIVFTEPAAWEFIADRLEEGHEFEEVQQDDPPGVSAYQMVIDLGLGGNIPPLFVKIRLGKGNTILGRSFHYSTQSEGATSDE